VLAGSIVIDAVQMMRCSRGSWCTSYGQLDSHQPPASIEFRWDQTQVWIVGSH
jgi:hypothetical protein